MFLLKKKLALLAENPPPRLTKLVSLQFPAILIGAVRGRASIVCHHFKKHTRFFLNKRIFTDFSRK